MRGVYHESGASRSLFRVYWLYKDKLLSDIYDEIYPFEEYL